MAPENSPLIITLEGDLNELTVFFAGRSGGTGTMTFLDADGREVDSPIDAQGDCAMSMPSSQTHMFSRPVRSIEVTASGSGEVWIDEFRINSP